ncbi:MAG TPA: hypothetical protein VJ974_04750 [Geopsychrobacteraceae bacterium]|nr:hypothetical protein [Geopsychrobacteraceae bacterium]
MLKELSADKRKAIWTTILVLLLLTVLLPAPRGLIFENALVARVDTTATEYVDESLIRASAAFVLARTINAIISVFEESELKLEPGGVGVSIALGEVLDPINDMIERFSWVMLVSVTSLGIQKVLIEIGPWFSIGIVLALGLILLIADLWIGRIAPVNLRRAGGTLVLFAILIRVAVPAMAALNHQVYESVLESRYLESTTQVEGSVGKLKKIHPAELTGQQPSSDQESSWWSSTTSAVKQTFEQGKNLLEVNSRLEAVKSIAFDMFNHLVNLIVVFVLNTLLLPLLFLWGFLRLGRILVGQEFGQRIEMLFREDTGSEKKQEGQQ